MDLKIFNSLILFIESNSKFQNSDWKFSITLKTHNREILILLN